MAKRFYNLESRAYGLQNETKQYLRRLYAHGRELAPADVADIDNFVKGLKQLNLWHNMVCWPMRSIHNVGSGSRLLSLGGFGNKDGNMINSPVWSSEGLNTFDGLSQRVDTPIIYQENRNNTLIFMGSLTPTSSTGRRIFATPSFFNTTPLYILVITNTTNSFRNSKFLGGPYVSVSLAATVNYNNTIPLSGYNFYAASLNTGETTSNWLSIRNDQTGTANWSNPPASYPLAILAGQTVQDHWTGTASFAAYYNNTLNAGQLQNLRTVIKTTIGKGLNLP
jgi:hypothetical protein